MNHEEAAGVNLPREPTHVLVSSDSGLESVPVSSVRVLYKIPDGGLPADKIHGILSLQPDLLKKWVQHVLKHGSDAELRKVIQRYPFTQSLEITSPMLYKLKALCDEPELVRALILKDADLNLFLAAATYSPNNASNGQRSRNKNSGGILFGCLVYGFLLGIGLLMGGGFSLMTNLGIALLSSGGTILAVSTLVGAVVLCKWMGFKLPWP